MTRDIRRWWNYKDVFDERPSQKEIFFDDTRFKVVIAGRRWGKGVLGAEWLVKKAINSDEGLCWAMGQTLREVKKYYLKPIKERLRFLGFNVDELKGDEYEFDCEIRGGNNPEIRIKNKFGNWSTIEFMSYNNEAALVGRGLDALLLDEFRYMRNPDIFEEQLFPCLTDREGELLIISTPHGRDKLYNLYMLGNKKDSTTYNPKWKSWLFSSYDNIYIKDKIESIKNSISPEKFAQEYLCSFDIAQDRAYHEFDYLIHVTKRSIDYTLPLYISWDFNRKKMTTTISQIVEGKKEPYVNENGILIEEQDKVINALYSIITKSGTSNHCIELLQWLNKMNWTGSLYMYGDATGKSGSANSNTVSWDIIKSMFYQYRAYYSDENSNPRIEDRVDAVNMKLLNTENKIGIFIDKDNADALIKDFEQIDRDEMGRIRKEHWERLGYNHNVENFGYMVEYEFPANNDNNMVLEPIWIDAKKFA